MVKRCGLIHTNTFTKGKNKVDPAPKHPQRHVEGAEVNLHALIMEKFFGEFFIGDK
jgi:hypothetical protein